MARQIDYEPAQPYKRIRKRPRTLRNLGIGAAVTLVVVILWWVLDGSHWVFPRW